MLDIDLPERQRRNIGKRIRKTRERERITQRTLAERIGVGVDRVSLAENGKLRISQEELNAICRALNCQMEDLLTL